MKQSKRIRINGLNFVRNRKPDDMPQAMWDGLGCYRIIGTMCGYGALLASVLLVIAGLQVFVFRFDCIRVGDFTRHWLVPMVWFLMLVLAIIPRIAIRRYLLHVQRNNCELCTKCGYSLHGLPTKHACPECGAAFDIDETRSFWKTLLERNTGRSG